MSDVVTSVTPHIHLPNRTVVASTTGYAKRKQFETSHQIKMSGLRLLHSSLGVGGYYVPTLGGYYAHAVERHENLVRSR